MNTEIEVIMNGDTLDIFTQYNLFRNRYKEIFTEIFMNHIYMQFNASK